MTKKQAAAGCLAVVFCLGQMACTAREGDMDFIVYYGEGLSQQDVGSVELAIVEPERTRLAEMASPHTRFLAYLSIGEVNDSRPYWDKVQAANIVVEENENWPGAHRVDVRSVAWRDLLLNDIIPALFAQGYQGLFLDTVDTASYLEDREPKRFKGASTALLNLVRDIKKRHPDQTLLLNNALDHLPQLGDTIDGVVVEDLYTRYDFATKRYLRTRPEDDAVKEGWLDAFNKGAGKPVYVIIYAPREDQELERYGRRKARAKGYRLSVSDIDLTRLPSRY